MKNIIYFLAIICISCNTLRGHRGVSNDIEESKERGVFVCELHSLSNPYRINDTLSINIKSAWLEKSWRYGVEVSETVVISDIYQLVIDSDKQSIVDFPKRWQIGTSRKNSYRLCSSSSIMIDMDTLPISNKLEWNVTLGKRRYNDSMVIGKFELFISDSEE
jgi:hypothetical protein